MLKGPLQAHCAICRGDSAVCGHEAERLRQALQDAQARWLAQDRIRDVRYRYSLVLCLLGPHIDKTNSGHLS